MFSQAHRRKAQGCGGKDSGDGGHGINGIEVIYL